MKDHETECPGRICMPQTEGCLDSSFSKDLAGSSTDSWYHCSQEQWIQSKGFKSSV